MHSLKSEIRLSKEEKEQAKSHGRAQYLLPPIIIGTLSEDEPVNCKSKEPIVTWATRNLRAPSCSGDHSFVLRNVWTQKEP